jgi:pimeloyl-ACP methyl ester carboxylesterase
VTPLPPLTLRVPWPRRDLMLPDRTLSIRESGSASAEPTVFIHGLGGSSTNWTDLMELLGERIDGVALDLPGFGFSPPPRDGEYTPAGHARPVHVFGNSLGGAVAVQLVGLRPDLVASLTLVSPALPEFRPRRTNVQLPILATPGLGAGVMDKYLQRPADSRVRDSIDICFADPGVVPPHRFEEARKEAERWARLPYASDAMRTSLRGLLLGYLTRSESPWRTLSTVNVPLLCIYGRADKLVNPAGALRVTHHVLGARIVVLPGIGHVAQLETPTRVAEIWLDWRRSF